MTNYILGFLLTPSPAWASEPVGMESMPATPTHGILDMVFGSGLVVQLVLFLLVMFSVLSWAVILSKFRTIRAAKKQNAAFYDVFWHAGSLSAAYNQTKTLYASSLGSLFRLAYGELTKVMRVQGTDAGGMPTGVMENLRRSLSRARAAEVTRLGRGVTFLATTANTAPFVGLFGTVWGIMDAFQSIGMMGSANLATVAPGIAEALVATATGLFAAIPAVVFYNHFNRRLEVLDSEMDSFTQDFLNLVERDLMRRQGPPVEAVRPSGSVA